MEEPAFSDKGIVRPEPCPFAIMVFIAPNLHNAILVRMSCAASSLYRAYSTHLVKVFLVIVRNALGRTFLGTQEPFLYDIVVNHKWMNIHLAISVLAIHLPVYQSPDCAEQP